LPLFILRLGVWHMAAMFLNGSRARLLLCLLAFSTCTPATAIADSSSARSSSYNKTIVWTPCGLNLTIPLLCGTLDVPLDYTATSGNVSTLTLKLAKFPSSQQPSRGSILVNPGGPGYGGRNALIGLGPLIQKFVPNLEILHVVANDLWQF
jgi:hypothetical protein